MNKSFLALCLVFAMMIALITAQKVTFSFDADKVFKDVPVNLLIDASGLYRNEDVILEFGIKANTLNLNLSQLLDDEGTCFDQTTGQATFGLSGSGNTFILSASSDFDFSKVFPEDSATTGFSFKIRCPVMISAIPPTPATPVSLTANGFGWDTTTTKSISVDATLQFPAEFSHPLITFSKVDVKQPNRATESGEVTFEFSVEQAGTYQVGLINSYSFIPISMNERKHSPFYCSSGSNKEFAAIVYGTDVSPYTPLFSQGFHSLSIIIPAITGKTDVKCSAFIPTPQPYVSSERAAMTISYGAAVVTRSFDQSLIPGFFASSIFSGNNNNDVQAMGLDAQVTANANPVMIDIVAGSLQASSTTININSTIVFKFENIDVTTLVLEPQQQEYQGFECNFFDSFSATISTRGTDEIVLKDISSPVNVLRCEFQFQGSEAFHYAGSKDMGRVSVSIDGKKLDAVTAPGKDSQLFLGSMDSIFNIDSTVTQTFATDTYTITQTFDISDNYSNVHITPSKPVAIVSYGGKGAFKAEDTASFIQKCQITSPTNSAFQDVKLTYLPEHYVWTLALKDIVDLESYKIQLKCTFQVKQMLFNGADVTPTEALDLTVIDLIDDQRYSSIASNSHNSFNTNTSTRIAPTASPVCLLDIAGQALLTNAPFAEQYDATTAAVQKTIKALLAAAQIKNDVNADVAFDTMYSIAFAGKPVANDNSDDYGLDTSNYEAPQGTQKLQWDFAYQTNKNQFEGPTFASLLSMVQNYGPSRSIVPEAMIVTSSFGNPAYFNQETQLQFWNLLQSIELKPTAGNKLTDFSTVKYNLGLTDLSAGIPDLDKASLAITVNQAQIPVSNSFELDSSCQYVTPVTQCGYLSGMRAVLDSGSDFNTKFSADNWDPFDSQQLCQLGDACTTNLDCAGTMICSASKCSEPVLAVSPYVYFQAASNKMAFKDAFNASFGVRSVVAVALAAVFALFF